VAAWEGGLPRVAGVEKGPTIASAIAVSNPGALGNATLESLRASNGAAVGVTDPEILQATRFLAEEGVFVEPSGAVTIAALPKLVQRGDVGPRDRVVCVLTGSGFKDFERIQEMVKIPDQIIRDYAEMEALAAQLG
jgi:threonine synthase